jgi:hypothetical protein
MPQRIFKYKVEPLTEDTLWLPEGAKILSAKEQRNTIVLYAQVDPEKEKIPISIITVGTDHVLPEGIDKYTFLDTVKMYDGTFMFHVYYKVNEL